MPTRNHYSRHCRLEAAKDGPHRKTASKVVCGRHALSTNSVNLWFAQVYCTHGTDDSPKETDDSHDFPGLIDKSVLSP